MSSDGHRTEALVLSGGGADGAYAVGVIKALVAGMSSSTEHRPLVPEVFTGTSIGSFNAAYLLSHWDNDGVEAAKGLEQAWLGRLAEGAMTCGNGAYRIRANPLTFLDPRCYVPNPLRPIRQAAGDAAFLTRDGLHRLEHALTATEESPFRRASELFDLATFISAEPWHETLCNLIDYSSIRGSSRRLRVAATNWTDGELEIFNNAEMTDEMGPQVLAASSALPGFYPPTQLGTEQFVDGGVLLNTPLAPAIRAGGETIHLIFLDPDISSMPLDAIRNTLETLYRMQAIQWAAAVKADIAASARINQMLTMLQAADRLSSWASGAGGPKMPQEYESIRQRYSRYSQVTIHRYSPTSSFGGALSLLDLRQHRLKTQIDRGFADAVGHDCSQSGCVLPGPTESSPDEHALPARMGGEQAP